MLSKSLTISAIFLWTFGLCDCISSPPEIATCEDQHGVYLDLSNSGITKIHKSFISSPYVTCISLKHNKITIIEEGAFGELTNLRYLNLEGNNIPHEAFLTTTDHQSIETLVLDDALVRPSHQRSNGYYTTPSYMQISPIYPTISMKMPMLKTLYLRKNNLSSISVTSWTENMPNLTHLFLSDNQINSVDFLKYAPSTLTHVFLDRNRISQFISRSLNGFEELIMDHNSISTLCGFDNFCEKGMTLKNAVNLKTLSLSQVGLETIEPDAMEDLISLNNLNLSQNLLHSIAKHTFDNLTNLITLQLHRNEFSTIPDACALKNLEIFTMDYNHITSIADRFSCSLPKLKILSLSHNFLNSIAPGTFDKLSSLEELDLSGNQLETLSSNWMPSENSLRQLHLNDNSFRNIESMSLNNMTELKSVNITGNPLVSFSIKSLMQLPENTVIDSMQSCDCDCAAYRRMYG